jgi:hypothetical protein
LLTAAEVTELQAGLGKEQKLGKARACSFEDAPDFDLGVAIFDDLSIDDVAAVNREVKPLPNIGRHRAVQSIGGIDTCGVSIEVTKTSRVDTLGTAGGDERKSCDIALRVAKLVEPKLPGS